MILIVLLRITSTIGSLIKNYFIFIKNWSQQKQYQIRKEISIEKNDEKDKITNEETSIQMMMTTMTTTTTTTTTSETIIVESLNVNDNNNNDRQNKNELIEDENNNVHQQSLMTTLNDNNDEMNLTMKDELQDELLDLQLEKNVQINYVESLKLELIQELTDYYEQIKTDIKSRAEYEKSRFESNILNDDKRDNIDLISEKLIKKVDDLIRKTDIDLNNYFEGWSHHLNDSSLNSLNRESVKMGALKCFAVFISNDSLLSELAKNYPVGVLCYSDYYLSAYQQAFLRLVININKYNSIQKFN